MSNVNKKRTRRECRVCFHTWIARVPYPSVCPKCLIKLNQDNCKSVEVSEGFQHTEEAKKKISAAHKKLYKENPDAYRGKFHPNFGRHLSAETKAKISAANFGMKNGNYGKHPSEETLKKISDALSGEKHPLYGKSPSLETRRKMSEAKKGKKVSQEVLKKMSERMRGEKNHNFGRDFSLETRLKLSESHQGSKSVLWQGGISFGKYCSKFTLDLRRRVRAYFNYQCIICGKQESDESRNLSVHHVEYNKNACCDEQIAHFAALCHSCHSKTNHNRDYWKYVLCVIIYEIYNEKSYFTKEEWVNIVKQTKEDKI